MAAAVADSDVVIDYLRGRETTPGLLETLATAGELRITTVSRFEVLSGLSPGRTRDRFLQLLADTPTLDFDDRPPTVLLKSTRSSARRGSGLMWPTR